jgi:glycosyltransferase involved in cell wall biosynthesis
MVLFLVAASRKISLFILDRLLCAVFMLLAVISKRKSVQYIWTPRPLMNNRYFSASLKQMGYDSITLVEEYNLIHPPEFFDMGYDDLFPFKITNKTLKSMLGRWLAFLYIVKNAKVIHINFSGGPLSQSCLKKYEAHIYRKFNIKVIVYSYGSDAYYYNSIPDPTLIYALLQDRKIYARNSTYIENNVRYWEKFADVVIRGMMLEGASRYDVLLFSALVVDTNLWLPKKKYSKSDGVNAAVKIIHSPNFNGFKGTNIIIKAIEELKIEGLKIEFIYLQKMHNDLLREKMAEADIHVEQILFTGYGLNGIEGMALGLPVLSNLDNEYSTRVFRRFSYLDECAILSTTPENIKENLRVLIRNPELREELGKANRAYVEKYHSYKASQYLFGSIYHKLFKEPDLDIMNLYNPLTSVYNNSTPKVKHPLVDNKIPENIKAKLN